MNGLTIRQKSANNVKIWKQMDHNIFQCPLQGNIVFVYTD